MGQFEHVVMLPADDPVTPHFNGIGRREAHRDGVVVPIQADEQHWALGCRRSLQEGGGGQRGSGFGAGRADCFLRLDRWGRAQYVCLHGVCFPIVSCLGRESHNLWLGTVHAVQPTFTPESRHPIRFHRQPYCLGHIEHHMPKTPQIGFGDNVRVRATPDTESRGLAGLVGQVYGFTTPSVTAVSVIGQLVDDYALNVHFDGRKETFWFIPELLELIDHGAGTEIRVGGVPKSWVRSETGEWIEKPDKKP